jgi:hypothetical protein
MLECSARVGAMPPSTRRVARHLAVTHNTCIHLCYGRYFILFAARANDVARSAILDTHSPTAVSQSDCLSSHIEDTDPLCRQVLPHIIPANICLPISRIPIPVIVGSLSKASATFGRVVDKISYFLSGQSACLRFLRRGESARRRR